MVRLCSRQLTSTSKLNLYKNIEDMIYGGSSNTMVRLCSRQITSTSKLNLYKNIEDMIYGVVPTQWLGCVVDSPPEPAN